MSKPDPAARQRTQPEAQWNWARTHRFSATQIERPTSNRQLQAVIAAAATASRTVRCVGSRHSFTNIADGDVLIDLRDMPERFERGVDDASVTVNGAMIYSRLAELLRPIGQAVANMASLPHISVAGATATATHGSGDGNGNLATSIRAIEIVTANGDLRRIERGDRKFPAAAVSLGVIGVVVAVELDLVPSFQLRQFVHNSLGWDTLRANFDAVFGSAYSVSVFTNWVAHLQLWTKERTDADPVDHAGLHDGVLATEQHHPIPGVSAMACTEQGPTSGRWDERLPHFRAGAVPSAGAEVQSEFFIHRTNATRAIAALQAIGPHLAPHLMVSEVRTVAADNLWLSPQYERDCVAFHFTWYHDMASALAMAQLVAKTLALFTPLPHWGKVFDPAQFDFAALYPRLGDAQHAFATKDPTGMFRNAWFDTTFG